MNININDLFPAPEPVFMMLDVAKKKSKKLFRNWGAVRSIRASGEIIIVRKPGYERAHKRTDKVQGVAK